jgi:tungstate transport system ATP-binding protein
MADNRGASGLPIVCEAVSVARAEATILRELDLVIAAGRRTFVLGPNGSGKSTLLRALHGLIPTAGGRITWGGRDDRPGGQAMVFQRAILLRRSVEANLRYALGLADVRGAEADTRIAEALDLVGLAALRGRPARVLSGGEQQKLALARAWSLRPEILFLDEPTASLDPAAARAVEAIVRDIHARGTTIVMTTHNLAQAKRLAQEIVFLHGGRVVEHGNPATFFASPQTQEAADYLDGERL